MLVLGRGVRLDADLVVGADADIPENSGLVEDLVGVGRVDPVVDRAARVGGVSKVPISLRARAR